MPMHTWHQLISEKKFLSLPIVVFDVECTLSVQRNFSCYSYFKFQSSVWSLIFQISKQCVVTYIVTCFLLKDGIRLCLYLKI